MGLQNILATVLNPYCGLVSGPQRKGKGKVCFLEFFQH